MKRNEYIKWILILLLVGAFMILIVNIYPKKHHGVNKIYQNEWDSISNKHE